MSFDWVNFLESTGIEHRVGPAQNVRRGHVGINCPRCTNDTKFFFSIDLETGKTRGCWWDQSHWMGSAELIAFLLHCPIKEAFRILEEGDFPVTVNPRTLRERLEKGVPEQAPWKPQKLSWPKEAQTFSFHPGRREREFHRYLEDRGFEEPKLIAGHYGLRWCADGDWKCRLLFPLYYDEQLVGWTGRAITQAARVRYKTHPPGDSVRHLLWSPLGALGGELLVLCEGPFDALKLDWFANGAGHALALLGLNVGRPKLGEIVKVARGFRRIGILLDRGAESQARSLRDELAILGPILGELPEGVKDPGDLNEAQVREVLRGMRSQL